MLLSSCVSNEYKEDLMALIDTADNQWSNKQFEYEKENNLLSDPAEADQTYFYNYRDSTGSVRYQTKYDVKDSLFQLAFFLNDTTFKLTTQLKGIDTVYSSYFFGDSIIRETKVAGALTIDSMRQLSSEDKAVFKKLFSSR